MATMEAAEKRRTSLSPVSGTYLFGAVRALDDLLGLLASNVVSAGSSTRLAGGMAGVAVFESRLRC